MALRKPNLESFLGLHASKPASIAHTRPRLLLEATSLTAADQCGSATGDRYVVGVQPLATAVIRRPFHWGIVIVTDGKADHQLPDVDPNRLVTADQHGIIALVRHAQDIESFDGDFDWAESEVIVRLLPTDAVPADGRREIYRGVLITPSGRISIGDADGDVLHPAHQGSTYVVVSASAELEDGDLQPASIQLDLLPRT